MAIVARHGNDTVAVRVVKRLLIMGAFVCGFLHSIRAAPAQAATERHRS